MANEEQTPSGAAPMLSQLEALLYHYGEPLPVSRAAEILTISADDCAALAHDLARAHREDERSGLALIEHAGAVQLVTKPSCAAVTEALMRSEFREELSPAALEVLSLIAYLGPVPRSTVDYIRGVNSSFTVRNLLVRGLVERDVPATKGNAYAYRTSVAFLHHVGLERVEDLPEYPAFRERLNRAHCPASEAEPAASLVSPISGIESAPAAP